MSVWQDADRVRDDDPYHAWNYDRIESGVLPPPLSRENATPPDLCPVIVEVQVGEKQRASLIKNLQALADRVIVDGRPPAKSEANVPLVMPSYEFAHLSASIAALSETPKAPIGPAEGEIFARVDYARLYLIYVEECHLYPTTARNPEDWIGLEPIYVGTPQPSLALDDAVDLRENKRASAPSGVLVIIDDSFAFLNERFVSDDGTRFQEIWFQGVPSVDEAGQCHASSRIDCAAINAALAKLDHQSEAEIYASPITSRGKTFVPLDFGSDAHQPLAFAMSHGTHVASTAIEDFYAATQGEDLLLYGVAVPTSVTAEASGATLGGYLLAAIRQSMMWADAGSSYAALRQAAQDDCAKASPDDALPLVINLSYGFSAGPKDGSSPLNKIIARMLAGRNDLGRRTEMVVAMGNGFAQGGVAEIEHLENDASFEVDWVIHPDDRTPSYLEIFSKTSNGTGDCHFTLEITVPDDAVPDFAPKLIASNSGLYRHLVSEQNKLMASVSAWTPNPESLWEARAFIALAPSYTLDENSGSVPFGRWRLKVTNRSGRAIDVRAFVQRDDEPGTYTVLAQQSYLDTGRTDEDEAPEEGESSHSSIDVTDRYTNSVFTCINSPHVHAVGAGMGLYGDQERNGPEIPSPYASSGPRYGTKIGPDCSALVDRSFAFLGLYRAATRSGVDGLMSGSSVAAPRLAGHMLAHLLSAKGHVPEPPPTAAKKPRRTIWESASACAPAGISEAAPVQLPPRLSPTRANTAAAVPTAARRWR